MAQLVSGPFGPASERSWDPWAAEEEGAGQGARCPGEAASGSSRDAESHALGSGVKEHPACTRTVHTPPRPAPGTSLRRSRGGTRHGLRSQKERDASLTLPLTGTSSDKLHPESLLLVGTMCIIITTGLGGWHGELRDVGKG